MHQFPAFYLQIAPFMLIYLVSADYVFKVFPVENCPMCKEDWEMASRRLGCNSTHGYHCVPNRQFTSLIEFCYPKGPRFPFEKGNCLKLAADGVLNQVSCAETFEDGCPKNHYFSNEMYNFPKCLMISKSLRCFDADHECIYSALMKNKANEQDSTTTKSNVTSIESYETTTESNALKDGGNQCSNIESKDDFTAVTISLAIIIVTIVIGLFVIVVYIKMRRRQNRILKRPGNSFAYKVSLECTDENKAFENEPFIGDNEESKIPKKEALQKLHDVIQSGDFDEFKKHFIQDFDKNALEEFNPRGFNSLHIAAKSYKDSLECTDENKDSAFENEPFIGDNEKSKIPQKEALQKLHEVIQSGDFDEFKKHYIQDFDKNALEEFNPRGFNSLHIAAKSYKDSLECTDENKDSAFENEPFIGDNEESKIPQKEALQKLHDVIQSGDFDEFKHFIQDFDKNALEEFNPRGFNSLHIAAKGENFNIFKYILDTFKIDIETRAIDKRNVLHIAAFYGRCSSCRYILENHKKLFDVKDRYHMNPAHWAALNGQESILKIMSEFNCNLSEVTPKYDENIVLFACIGESYDVCKFVGSTEGIAGILHWKNSEGWNSIQYAAKSGNLKVFKYLCEMDVDIENKSRQTGKNCLHTACERGNIEICTYILEERKDETLITQSDKHEQHVGHFTAKSGNKNILDLLIKHLRNTTSPNLLEKPTTDKINILHIACRHARLDMCVKIADKFPSMISEITERGWNAALFITEKAGAEKERIMILKFLEKRKLNVYHVSRSGKTILYNACVNRSAILVRYLLKHYPDLLKIEKSMDPRKAAKSQDIENIFMSHFSQKNENQTVMIK